MSFLLTSTLAGISIIAVVILTSKLKHIASVNFKRLYLIGCAHGKGRLFWFPENIFDSFVVTQVL
jgi:hypothetical protein